MATKAPSKAGKPGAANTEPSREARGARRKRETRAKLLQAAFELMAHRGPGGVAINEITEAADVGFGSFYNHFESKEAIHEAVVEDVLLRFAETLSHIADTLDDPAEILVASFRYVASRARREPLWGRFLVRTAFSLSNLAQGMGIYLFRDLQRGFDSGRFQTDDRATAVLMVGGALAAAINTELELGGDPERGRQVAAALQLDFSSLADRTAVTILRFLGLTEEDAHEVAHRPLPPMPLERPRP